jgi:hypothetical protein
VKCGKVLGVEGMRIGDEQERKRVWRGREIGVCG